MAAKGKPVGTAYAELDLDSNKMEQGLKRVHDTLVKGTIKTEDAFKQLGIKSDATYEKMRVNALLAFDKITSSAKTSADDRLRAEQALVSKLKTLHDQQHGNQVANIEQTKSAFASLGGALGAVSLAAAAYKAVEIGKEFAASGLSAERLALSLKAATGSYHASISAMQFLRAESARLGTDLFSSADGFVKLSASAKGTSLEGEKTREIFTALSTASAALKLTNDQTSGAIMAISQMMSKGSVQAEELRGQLAERLPGSFNLAAKAMGVTTAELGKMLEKGEVVSSDFLPRFARVLTQEYGAAATDAADSTQAAVNRMNNAWEEAKRTIGESLLPTIAKAAVAINNMIQSIAPDNMTDLEKIGALTAKIENLTERSKQPGMGWVLGDELKKAETDLKKLEYAAAGVTRETGSWARGVREMNQVLSDQFSKGDSWKSFFPGKSAADDRGAKDYLSALQDSKGERDAIKSAREYAKAIEIATDAYNKLTMSAYEYSKNSVWMKWEKDAAKMNEFALAARDLELQAIETKAKVDELKDLLAQSKARADFNILLMPSNYNTDSFMGAGAANKRAEKMIEDAAKTMSEMEVLSKRTAEAMEKNFSNFFFDTMTGKFNSFESFLEGIMQSILRMVSDYMGQVARTIMFGSEANKIGGIVGSIVNSIGSSDTGYLSGGYMHSGGIVGRDYQSGSFPASMFAHAPRLHSGLKSDEFPAILQRGEAVIPKGGGATSAPNITVNVQNNTGNPIAQPKISFDAQGMILDLVMDGVNRDINGARSFFGGR